MYKRKARFTKTNNNNGIYNIQVTREDKERVII